MQKSLKELNKILKERLIEVEDTIESFKNNDNPQVRELLIKAEREKSVLDGIIFYAETGDKSLLR